MGKLKTFFAAMAFSVFGAAGALAQGIAVFDNANLTTATAKWMTAIDTLYANYDMVMNTITQIENQYRQIQQAVERAKGIDWSNIRFDGDFDIRNDIRDANRRVNKLLTQARTIKESLNTNVIKIPGGAGYSLADLCGLGEDETKDIFKAAADVYGYMNKNMQDAFKAVTGEITPSQATAIMAKYGISPRNYWFCVQTENQLNNAIGNAIAHLQDAATEMTEETEDSEKRSAIFTAAEQTVDSDGNMPEGATSEGIMRLLGVLSEQFSGMKTAMREATGLTSLKMMDELKKEEAKASQRMEDEIANQQKGRRLPESFVDEGEKAQ